MKKILLSILVLSISCEDKRTERKNSTRELAENWTEFNTKDSIPELLTLTLRKMLNDDFEIANPNENFNKTDVIINDSIPTRQLRLLSSKNNFWRITYIQGGFGKYYVYAECKIKNDSISDFKFSQSNLKLESNDSIDKYLSEKKLEPRKVKIILE